MSEPKLVTFPTNFNKKLECDLFVHIQKGSTNGIPESTVLKIATADQSHAPVVVSVIDSVRQPLKDLSLAFIYLSHGLDKPAFIDLVSKADPGTSMDQEMVVYFYKKIEGQA